MKKIINTSNAPLPVGPYNQAILVDKTLYMSGQIALDIKSKEIVNGTIEEETEKIMYNIKAILDEVGADFSQVVKTTAHLQNCPADFAEYDKVYREFLTAPFPVRTTVGSDLINILVEIDFVVAL